jgi:hypothetical protein
MVIICRQWTRKVKATSFLSCGGQSAVSSVAGKWQMSLDRYCNGVVKVTERQQPESDLWFLRRSQYLAHAAHFTVAEFAVKFKSLNPPLRTTIHHWARSALSHFHTRHNKGRGRSVISTLIYWRCSCFWHASSTSKMLIRFLKSKACFSASLRQQLWYRNRFSRHTWASFLIWISVRTFWLILCSLTNSA